MQKHILTRICAASLTILFVGCRSATPSLDQSKEGLVVSEARLASEAGASILRKGGNAVDAAVATAFALAVVHPSAGNLGGGGFLVVYLPDGDSTTFDFRETAPLRARSDIFLREGTYDPELHHWSHLAVGVPGTVAGLYLAHEKLGRLSWQELVEPAVRLAADGFPVSLWLAKSLRSMLPEFRKHPATLALFSKNGEPFEAGDTLVQSDLAGTLERIRDKGPMGFYRGETADLLVAEMERGGGLITHEDLTSYRAVEREPVRGTYRGFEILSMPPPSSGGVALIQMLNILEGYDLTDTPRTLETHLLIEAMRRAFADRARYLGDPDFVAMPLKRLLSVEYASELRRTINPTHASTSSPKDFQWPEVGQETTHLSVVDRNRMAASLTTTLEQSFGVRIAVAGAGFLLNNEMGDFNPEPGLTSVNERVETPPNLVEPKKRMLSSMTPTIVTRDGDVSLVIGSPGGRTIINTVLQIVVKWLDHRMPIQEAVDSPRFHHQWLPDSVVAESDCFTSGEKKALEELGHRIRITKRSQGRAMGVAVTADERLQAGVDRRAPDGGAATDEPGKRRQEPPLSNVKRSAVKYRKKVGFRNRIRWD